MGSRHVRRSLLVLLLGTLCMWPVGGRAQTNSDPDVRNLQPFVMVIVDSSGSMEELPACTCPTGADYCPECLPDCTLANDAQGNAPAGKKNRWAVALEALTGSFKDFQCTVVPRQATYGATFDVGYFIPYHQPWACSSGVVCPYPYPIPITTPIQNSNGVLDTYAGRIRFGLMTFDSWDTYVGAPPEVPVASWNDTLSTSDKGLWSYGGPHSFHYPGCTNDYNMDTGARSPTAIEGALTSVSSTNCPSGNCDIYTINGNIQDALLRTRPYGGTPIAGALDDLYYHFKTDMQDSFAGCRDRYALLITDGRPNSDYREVKCDCQDITPSLSDPEPCGHVDATEIAKMHCPYDRPEQVAHDLITGRGGDGPQMKKLYVIGMSINDTGVKTALNTLAYNGGSTDLDADGNYARFADQFGVLQATLDKLFDGLSNAVSRSVPAYATGLQNPQYQVSTGFAMALGQPVNGIAPPWAGIIERRRFTCSSTSPDPVAQDLDANPSTGDLFHAVLNTSLGERGNRDLWTAFPTTGNPTVTTLQGQLERGLSTSKCQLNGCSHITLDDGAVTTTLMSLATNDVAGRKLVLDWMYGNAGSVRATARLGDIYHSSPVIVSPVGYDNADDAYTAFRNLPEVANRPSVVYVGSNDGILHAFSLETYVATTAGNTPNAGKSYVGGQELWGFVPPTMIPKLKAQLSAHQLGMDSTPEVKDVFIPRFVGGHPVNEYHTVLITGMRGGGNAYVALDISDPINPVFMWQYSDVDMGLTYGKPAIVQATYNWPDGTGTVVAQQRAVAILPGGAGKHSPTGPGCSTNGLVQPTTQHSGGGYYYSDNGASVNALPHRSSVPCWASTGRALYFVDVETGQLIKKIYDSDTNLQNGTIFPSPLVGSPTANPDTVGSLATRGFVVDADGVIWRIDMGQSDPLPLQPLAGWTVRPFHDIFWSATSPSDDEVSYEKPILSFDNQHRLVVIVATGDTDNFEKSTVHNRIVSVTEVVRNTPPTGPDDYAASVNWELRDNGLDTAFVQSELVTGGMALFEGQLFAPSFVAVPDVTDPCSFGRGRLWALDYNGTGTEQNPPAANGAVTYGPKRVAVTRLNGGTGSGNTDTSGGNVMNVPVSAGELNLLVQGLTATQRVTCQANATPLTGYFNNVLPSFTQATAPSLWIVAQASSKDPNKRRAASSLASIEVQMTRPASFSKVSAWAGSTD